MSPTLQVLFLSSDSGGGHNAVAQSMIDGMRRHANLEADILNVYQTRRLQLWPTLSKIRANSQTIWRAIYQTTDRKWLIRGVWKRLLPSFVKPLFRAVEERQASKEPDIVVAVHHASAQCLEPLANGMGRRPFTVVCVTDYDVHANWVAEADLYLAASDIAFRKLASAGKRVIRLPMLPCRMPESVSSKTVEAENEAFKIVMVMGLEGSSQNKARRLIDELLKFPNRHNIQVDVICGRNEKLKSRLDKEYQGTGRVSVHGYVDDIPERMRQANLALIRLSPQTMTEALAAGTPVVGFDWHVHEAECLNVLHKFGAGTGSLDVSDTVKHVKAFLENDTLRERWYDQAFKASQEASGSELTARWILDRSNSAQTTDNLCTRVG
ncbi:MAG: glycosyltransferase [Planctomycetota bacterium]